MDDDESREAHGSDLNEQERASILRFEQELKSLEGRSDIVMQTLGQRLMREIFDVYVGGSPAVRSRLQSLLNTGCSDAFRHFEGGAFLEGETTAETLEKRLIWDSFLAHDADVRDWGARVHDHCGWAAGEGISGSAIAEIIRGIADEYLPADSVYRDVLLREAADFENRYPSFERIERLLADSGVQIAKAQANGIFGSWFIEIHVPQQLHITWDGRERLMFVRTAKPARGLLSKLLGRMVNKLARGTLEWEDRWVSKEPTPEAVLATVLRILAEPS